MRNLANFFIENSKFTIVLSLFVVVFGVGGLIRINSESYPAVDFAMAVVTTNYDGATAQDIETQITKPLEDEIREVSGIKDVRSTSQAGVSKIFVRADLDNVDVPTVMADLQRAVDSVTDLPRDLKDPPVFTEIKSEEFPVVELAIFGNNENRKRDIIADRIKEELEDNKNILNARLTGYKERRFQVILDEAKLRRYHIGVNEVVAKVTSRNVNIPGGHLKQPESQQLLRVEGKIQNKEELESTPIRSNFSGAQVFLKDVASVVDGEEEAKLLASYNGEPATLLILTKKAGSDTVKLVDDIEAKLSNFVKQYPDYRFEVYNNEGMKVKNRLQVLSSNAISGLILVFVFLLIFLPGRTGFMASFSLPLAVLVCIGFMPTFGMNLDAITILALVIALGMMVDNSVVISENFSRLRGDGLGPKEAALESIDQLWLPITATAMTTIAAFLPMLVTKGIMGQFIKFIPIIVTIALVASLVESFVLLPMRLTLGGSKAPKQTGDWFQNKFVTRFNRFMEVLVRHRYLTAAGFTVLFVGSILMLTVGNSFMLFPPDQTEIYVGRIDLPKGTRLEKTQEVVAQAARLAKEKIGEHLPHVVGRAGSSQVQLTDPKAKEGNNVGMLVLYVDEYAKDNIKHTEILKKLRTIEIPGVTRLEWEALVNGPPVGEPVNATIRSNNMERLSSVVDTLIGKLKETAGVTNVQVNDVVGDDEIFVQINHAKADRLGLDVNLIGNTIRSAMSGKVITNVNLNNKEIDINIRMKEQARTNIKDLESLSIMDKRGNLIPLSKLASFNTRPGAIQIKRYDYKRSKTITASVTQDQITAIQANKVVKDVFAELQPQFPDVSLVFGGEEENTKESMDSLWSALVLSLIGIFALLVFLFRSYLRPMIIMSTIPLGLVGFSIAFALHQRPISFLALIGIIGLGGIIVNSGIVLISFIDQMRAEGGDLHEVLIRASGLRLRAVVVTALTTIVGLMPTAYGIGGSDALLIPMTLAMAWGLTSGTILTLVWVPCAYAILEDWNSFVDRLMGKKPKLSPVTGDVERDQING